MMNTIRSIQHDPGRTRTRNAVLAVDDEWTTLERYESLFRSLELQPYLLCSDPAEVLPTLAQNDIGLVLLDVYMPGIDGISLLRTIGERHPTVPVIMVTSENDTATVVRCMKLGAFDYLTKPIQTNRLANAIRHGMRIRELERTVDIYQSDPRNGEISQPDAFAAITGGSTVMTRVLRHIEAVAPSPEPVLITGESGTGKELVARAIHDLSGRRGRFVAVNASGLDDAMLSDTLFGHADGAFPGAVGARAGLAAQAAGGTLFLDEIGTLESQSQVKLLRLLQEREYYQIGSDTPVHFSGRVVTATNADLPAERADGTFRTDLYYRLMTHRIVLPPLRARLDDIAPLVERFAEEAACELGRTPPAVPPRLLERLMHYDFPGNVRELKSLVFDAVVRSRGATLDPSIVEEYLRATPSGHRDNGRGEADERIPTLEEAEAALIERAMARTGGNQARAAQILGISQSTLSRRLRRPT